MQNETHLKRAAAFLVLCYVISYAYASILFRKGVSFYSMQTIFMLLGYMFIPLLVVVLLQKLVYHEGVMAPLGVSFRLNKWFAIAWIIPLVLAQAAFGVSLLMPGVHLDASMSGMLQRFAERIPPERLAEIKRQLYGMPFPLIYGLVMGIISGMLAGVTVNAAAAFGEELGWRGFLQKHLGFLGFWKSSLLIGLIWGFWHAPVVVRGFNYPEHPVIGVFVMALWTALLSPIFSYVRLRAGSVLAASVIHGTLNGTAALAIMGVRGGSDLTTGVPGLPGILVLAVMNAGLYVYQRYHASARLDLTQSE
jgi:membrane protease YdiL (CAAX protease family)